MTDSFSIPKAWFILSLLIFSFGYGFVSHAWGWFPKSFLESAWQQALWQTRQVQEDQGPHFTSDQVFDRAGARLVRPDEVQAGLTLISSSWKNADGWDPELRLINEEGKVLHRWRLNREEVFQSGITPRNDPTKTGVHGSLLLPEGHVIMNMEYFGTVRLNACGHVVWKMREGNHHSISRADDGSFWTPAVAQGRRSRSERYPDGFPGLEGKEMWIDRILHVGTDGEILKDITVLDILYENGLERYIPKVLGGPGASKESVHRDLTHLNDVEPLGSPMAEEYPLFEAGDLLVSLRNLNLVFVFDPETLEVRWHAAGPFIQQHDPDFLGDGWIGIFDNNRGLKGEGGQMLGGSRIVATRPHTDSTRVLFQGDRLDRFYTSVQGKWQQLENGNMLLAESNTGRAVEVDSEGRLVWEWIQEPFGNSTVPKVTNVTRHDLTREEVASWACPSVDSVGGSSKADSSKAK